MVHQHARNLSHEITEYDEVLKTRCLPIIAVISRVNENHRELTQMKTVLKCVLSLEYEKTIEWFKQMSIYQQESVKNALNRSIDEEQIIFARWMKGWILGFQDIYTFNLIHEMIRTAIYLSSNISNKAYKACQGWYIQPKWILLRSRWEWFSDVIMRPEKYIR